MNILFWNVGLSKTMKDIDKIHDCMREILNENRVDILVLAEYPFDTQALCHFVNGTSAIQYKSFPNISKRYRIRGIINSLYNIMPLQEENRYQLMAINTSYYTLILAMIHNISKATNKPSTQKIIISQFCGDIENREHELNCDNTIAIGDFNLDPFEDNCIGASAMHALPFADTVLKYPYRTVQQRMYRTFYNPTWKFFKSITMPFTTYYHNFSGEDVNFYWYALDQVVIRPSLIEAFDENSLRIISETNSHKLLKNGIPDENYSDHLPLFCSLKEDLLRWKTCGI